MTTQVSQKPRSDARDNRARILAVARAAFAAEGPGVPVREIARRAQVGAATVYRHFPTKDALLAEVVAEPMALCSAVVEEGLAESDPWRGFCLVTERLMEARALGRGLSGALAARLPYLGAERERSIRLLG
ncbi:TetR/AcrR family transcriptional regulator [Nonomuraea wenchangensis]|uniref:TetR/AcrR family transcriptional regulator n=1 Tax=Nonomuraea wenchangensis TaxID=568860 RepID=UPI0037B52C1D